MAAQTNVLITHPDTPIEELNKRELRSIFSLRVNRWSDNSPITVFVLPDNHASHHFFIRYVLNMLPHQLRRHWDHHTYAGLGQGPIMVENEDEMQRRVRETPGAIGYLGPNASDKGNLQGVGGKIRVVNLQ